MNNLADVLSQILPQLEAEKDYWFRGHSKLEFRLLPSVLRPSKTGQYYNEAKLLREFVRQHPEAREKHNSTLELLTYAQHYGLPTRLLDWTENLLVALYFCCSENGNSDGKIFSLKVKEQTNSKNLKLYEDLAAAENQHSVVTIIVKHLNNEILNSSVPLKNTILVNSRYVEDYEFTDPFKIQCELNKLKNSNKPISVESHNNYHHLVSGTEIYRPLLINQRLRSQRGVFTVHGGKALNKHQIITIIDTELTIDNIVQNSSDAPHNAKKYILNEFVIPAYAKKQILKDLSQCGVNKAALFPELEHQTNSIKDLCIYR